MNLSENIRLAWEGLRANKMRAILTMLGIIIGIASVIGILTVGDGMGASINDSMSSLGASNIMVSVSPRDWDNTVEISKGDLITDEMITQLKERYKDTIAGVSISENIGSGDASLGRIKSNVSVLGINDEYLNLNDIKILSGRGILQRDNDGKRNVAVVSDTLVDDLFDGDIKNAIGADITVPVGQGTDKFSIIGVYEYEQADRIGPTSTESSTDIYVPLSTAKQLTGANDGYSGITVSVSDTAYSETLSGLIQKFFNRYYQKNQNWQIEAFSMQTMLETLSGIMKNVSLALSVIAGISLLVGGIGVMNIMLVSVTERTREIGTRKAIGATNANIRVQFVVESIIVCLIGGIAGIALGATLGYIGSNMMGFAALPSIGNIMLAVGFSIGIGIFFGYYPANKAAKLDPIEALRYE